MKVECTYLKPKFSPIELVITIEDMAELIELRARLNSVPPISSSSRAKAAHIQLSYLWTYVNDIYQAIKWQ